MVHMSYGPMVTGLTLLVSSALQLNVAHPTSPDRHAAIFAWRFFFRDTKIILMDVDNHDNHGSGGRWHVLAGRKSYDFALELGKQTNHVRAFGP